MSDDLYKSYKDAFGYDLMQKIIGNIKCSVDKKNYIISINVKDQDPLVCATIADSVKQHLQEFIIHYRTSKATEDVEHYQHLRDSAELEYNEAMERYSRFCDSHRNVVLQSYQSMQNKLESELSLKQTSLGVMETQLTEAKVRLQEKTPAFTTLKSATVPVRPAGPKRLLFVLGMLMLTTTEKIISKGMKFHLFRFILSRWSTSTIISCLKRAFISLFCNFCSY